VKSREKRKNHSEDRVDGLLAVPRYADVLDGVGCEDSDPAGVESFLVTSRRSWRREMTKWREDERENDEIEDDEHHAQALNGQRGRRWLPCSLATLFGGNVKRPLERPKRQQFNQETLMMELLAAEYDEEPLDDGELEGSGDDYGS
jgi:hypothetical protein